MLIRYLLGQMSDAEQGEIAEQFFADDELFEQLTIVENDLIDRFVRGELSEDERKLFNQNYLSTAQRRRRVDTAKAFIEAATQARSNVTAKKNAEVANIKTEKTSWATWLRQPLFGFVRARAIAAVLLISTIFIAGFFLWRYSNKNSNEIVKTPTPSPTPSITPTPELANTNPTPFPSNEDNKNVPQKPETPKSAVAVVFLSSGTRGFGNAPTALLNENISGIKLQIEIKNASYSSYRVIVKRTTNAEVWTQKDIKRKGSLIETTIPRKLMSQGDYLVVVEGITDEGATEIIKESYFKLRDSK